LLATLVGFRDRLFNIFAAILHIGGRSSFPHLRMRNAIVIGTLSSRRVNVYKIKNEFFSGLSSLIPASQDVSNSKSYKNADYCCNF
jgi:hypothetical protein